MSFVLGLFETIYKHMSTKFLKLFISFVLGVFADRGRLLSLARAHWSLMCCATVINCKMATSIVLSLLLLAFLVVYYYQVVIFSVEQVKHNGCKS